MKIKLSSVLVEDQDKALNFYTEVLGFVGKTDIPMGSARWLTVVSPQAPDEVELLLEPNTNPASKTYQQALFEQGTPLTAFSVDDIQSEYRRLEKLGVAFRSEPVQASSATVADGSAPPITLAGGPGRQAEGRWRPTTPAVE